MSKSFFSLRERDETGHRTGLGTLAKSLVTHPVDTFKAGQAFASSYNEMKAANIKGGNLPAHEKANYEATKVAGPNVAAAFSAAREQFKTVRFSEGDQRTSAEVKATMDANKAGREKAMKEK